MNKIVITDETMASMHRHALAEYPNECVGFFFGTIDDEIKNIDEYTPLENFKEGDQRRRFEVNPKDYMQAEKYALENDRNFLGVYHSHPNHPADPSEHDLKQAVPFFSYIIASVKSNKVEITKSWQLNDDNEFEEENITNS